MSIKLPRIAHIAVEVYGFKSFANLLWLGYVFFKKESFESFKKRSWTRISNTVDRDWIFFLPRFRSTKKTAKAFFLAYRLTKSCRELSIHSVITVIHFSRAIKLYKRFYKIISRNYEVRKFWSVDYSSCFDFRYFLSRSTTPQIKLSCKSVNWQYAVIPAVQSPEWIPSGSDSLLSTHTFWYLPLR